VASRPSGMTGKTTAAATRHDLRRARGALGWAGSLPKDDCAMADTPETTKPKLKPANENPWYCLMTLHGEQPKGAIQSNFDTQLHEKNRRDWNKWASRALTEKQRKSLLAMRDSQGNSRFNEAELRAPTDSELAILNEYYYNRSSSIIDLSNLPDPHSSLRLDNVIFDRALNFSNFLLPSAVVFKNSIFFESYRI